MIYPPDAKSDNTCFQISCPRLRHPVKVESARPYGGVQAADRLAQRRHRLLQAGLDILGADSDLSALTVRGIAWGDLNEQPCEGDYGDIGGVQTVNCRLAATFLAPEETLQYLAHAEPNRLHISLSYSASF